MPRDDVLHSVYEYRKLLSQQQLLGGRLAEPSRRRLAELEARLSSRATSVPGAPRRRFARASTQINATLKAGGRVHPVQIVNLGAGGMCVEPAPALRGGERAVVRVASSVTGREYRYPVEARWVRGSGETSTMGLPFVGAPLLVVHDVEVR